MRLLEPALPRTFSLLRAAGFVTAAVFLAPLGYLLWTAVSQNAFARSVDAATIGAPLWRSIVLAAATTLASMVVGVALAWVTTRTDVPGKRLWRVAAALPLAIPSYVGAAGIRAAFGQGGLIPWVPRPGGFLGSLVVLTALTYPYVYLPVAARLLRMSATLEETARLLGDGNYRIARRVVLPQLQGVVAAGGLITFLYTLSDFGAVSLMRYDTITRAIYSSRLADRDLALTLGFLLGALAVAIALMERRLAAADEAGIYPVGRGRVYELGRARRGIGVATGSFLSIVLLSPVMVFVVWWRRGTLAAGATLAELGDSLVALIEPTANSALAGALAGIAAMVMLLPTAYLQRGGRSSAASLSNVAVASTFALPGLVLALAAVYWVLQAPVAVAAFYQSLPLLILVYVLHFGVQSHRASTDAVLSLPDRYGEAAKVLGARRIRRFYTVEAPLIGPGVIAGGGLVMLSTLKELPATLLLAPIGFDTLATRVWGAAEEGFLAEVGATSLVLMALSIAMTWLLVLRPTNLAAAS